MFRPCRAVPVRALLAIVKAPFSCTTGSQANVPPKRARHAAGLCPAVPPWAIAGRAGAAHADWRRRTHHAGAAHDGGAGGAGRACRRGDQRRAIADRCLARQLLWRQPGAQDHRPAAPQAGRRQPPATLHRNHPQTWLPAAAEGDLSRGLPRCVAGHGCVGARQPVRGPARVRPGPCGGVLRPQPRHCAGACRGARAVAEPARAGAAQRGQRLRQDLVAARRCGAVAGAARRAGWPAGGGGGVLQPGGVPRRRCGRHADACIGRVGSGRARGVFCRADGHLHAVADAAGGVACGHCRGDAPRRPRPRDRADPPPSVAGDRPCRSAGGHTRHHRAGPCCVHGVAAGALQQRARGGADGDPQRFLSTADRSGAGAGGAQTWRWPCGSAAATRRRDRPDHPRACGDGRAAFRRRPRQRQPPGRCAARRHRAPTRCTAAAAASAAGAARTPQRRWPAHLRRVSRTGWTGRRTGAPCRTDLPRPARTCAGGPGRRTHPGERDPPRQRSSHRAAGGVVGIARCQWRARTGGCLRAGAPVRQRTGCRRAGLCGGARSLAAAMAARQRMDP